MAKIHLEYLSKYFSDTLAVDDLTLIIEDGEFVTLLGPSGCGKTTTLRMVAGFVRPTAGSIHLGEQTITSVERGIFLPPERRQMGMVFQSYAVWPHMTVFENVAYPLKLKRIDRATTHQQVQHVLSMVRLDNLADRYPHQLSGGQQQRVALARSLAMEPKALLLDEPLSNLDAKLREEMRFEIIELQKRVGITIIYVTHDQAEALAMSDRIMVMNQGRAQHIGTPQEIYETPANSFVAGFIGFANFISGEVTRLTGDQVELQLQFGNMAHTIQSEVPKANINKGAMLMIRPEHVKLCAPETTPLVGQVLRRTYLGNRVDYLVEVGAERLRAECDPGEGRWREGEKVGLQLLRFAVLPQESQ